MFVGASPPGMLGFVASATSNQVDAAAALRDGLAAGSVLSSLTQTGHQIIWDIAASTSLAPTGDHVVQDIAATPSPDMLRDADPPLTLTSDQIVQDITGDVVSPLTLTGDPAVLSPSRAANQDGAHKTT